MTRQITLTVYRAISITEAQILR